MERDKQKKEAIRRMKKLGLMDDVISLFSKEDRLYYSERQNKQYPAVLYWLDNDPEYEQMVKDFEEVTGYLVYHVILTRTGFGKILDFLFVSTYEDDWEYEIERCQDGFYVTSQANNLTDESLSDMGSIVVRPAIGGLERIY